MIFHQRKINLMRTLFFVIIAMLTNAVTYAQKFFNPKSLFDPTPYGFSHITTISANAKLILIAGQGGEENVEGTLSPDFRRQTYQSLRNIEAALRSQGLTMSTVVKVTTLVVNHDASKLQILIEEFQKMWPDNKFPINTLIPVPRLALDNMLIEIDAIAVSN
jgi:enamine deaminase RidA (YjgF/YER057c/UK114 family)